MDRAERTHLAWGKTIVDQARVDLLERLYQHDGRGDKAHPLHNTYTGLYQKYTAI